MKKSGIGRLVAILVFLALLAFVAVFGITFGLREIKPLGQQLAEKKMGLDLKGGYAVVFQPLTDDVEDFEAQRQSVIDIYRKRLELVGMLEATVALRGNSAVYVEIPSSSIPTASITEFLRKSAKLEWKDPSGQVFLEGKDITKVQPAYLNNKYVIQFDLSAEAAQRYTEETTRLTGQMVTVSLDGTKIAEWTVRAAGKGKTHTLDGDFSAGYAMELAMLLDAGA